MKIKEEWKAYASNDFVRLNYLSKWYSTCEAFAKVVSLERVYATDRKKIEAWRDFFQHLYNSLFLIVIKTSKLEKVVDEEYKDILDMQIEAMLSKKKLPIREYFKAVTVVGDMLDRLGYNSPEQKQRVSSFLSDLELPEITTEEEI